MVVVLYDGDKILNGESIPAQLGDFPVDPGHSGQQAQGFRQSSLHQFGCMFIEGKGCGRAHPGNGKLPGK